MSHNYSEHSVGPCLLVHISIDGGILSMILVSPCVVRIRMSVAMYTHPDQDHYIIIIIIMS